MACRVARLSALLSLLLFVLDTRVVQAATNQPLCWQTGQQAYFASKKLERFEKRVPVCIVFGYQLDNRFVDTPAGVAAVPKLPCEDPNGECASNRGTEKSRATAREGNQIVFFPDVDEFTVLEVENSYNEQSLDSPAVSISNDVYNLDYLNMQVQVECGGVASSRKRRAKASSRNNRNLDYVVPFWTAIIRLKQGLVTEITWDEGCWTCEDDMCVEEFCAVNRLTECRPDQYDCDLKIYIAWVGTDKNGQYLTSSGRVFSNFEKYSIGDVYTNAKENAKGKQVK